MTFVGVFIKPPSAIVVGLVDFPLFPLLFIIYPSLTMPLLTVHSPYTINVEMTVGHVKT
jgi:hypothetical protein